MTTHCWCTGQMLTANSLCYKYELCFEIASSLGLTRRYKLTPARNPVEAVQTLLLDQDCSVLLSSLGINQIFICKTNRVIVNKNTHTFGHLKISRTTSIFLLITLPHLESKHDTFIWITSSYDSHSNMKILNSYLSSLQSFKPCIFCVNFIYTWYIWL